MNNMLENLKPEPVHFPDIVTGGDGTTTIAGTERYSMSYYQRGMCIACVSVTTTAAGDQLVIALVESTDAAGTTTATVAKNVTIDIATGGNTACGYFDFSSTDLQQNSGYRWVTLDGNLSHSGTAYVTYGFVFDSASGRGATMPDPAVY